MIKLLPAFAAAVSVVALILSIAAINQPGPTVLCRGQAFSAQTQVTETWYYPCANAGHVSQQP